MFRDFNIKPLVAAMAAASLLSACGGGGGGSDDTPSTANPSQGTGSNNPGTNNPGTNNPGNNNPGGTTLYAMSCAEGAGWQCSGSTARDSQHGVVVTDSSVQVFARSTSDLADPIVDKTTPTGMQLFDPEAGQQPLADVRVQKSESTGLASRVSLLLSGLGINWGTTERPQIIETFSTQQGRVTLVNGVPTLSTLVPSSNTEFYNFVTLGRGATQANYANNVYYAGSSSCTLQGATNCETKGLETGTGGDWFGNETGRIPSWFGGTRLHNDGDIHAGDGVPGATTSGVPFPGSKGYRSLDSWNYQYANLSSWVSQDTVEMAEWTGGSGTDEHNTARRGVVAFGAVTPAAQVPTTGTATYSGVVYGYYATNAATDPDVVLGRATLTVNYATRAVNVTFSNVSYYTENGAAVPLLAFDTTANVSSDSSRANYLNAQLTGDRTGGLGARFFGPVISTGTSGAGPAEIGGAMRFTVGTGGAAFIGGFIARKD